MRSTIVFFARLRPSELCAEFDQAYTEGNTTLSIQGEKVVYAETSDWDTNNPNWFEDLIKKVNRFLQRYVHSLAFLTEKALQVDLTDWIELERAEEKITAIGVVKMPESKPVPISNEMSDSALKLASIVSNQDPFFWLATSDYYKARQYPEEALIYLHRAIESIERFFGSEQGLRDALGVSKGYVDYITQRANDIYEHIRHASWTGAITQPPPRELEECFKRTREIIEKFKDYLSQSGPAS